MIRPETETLTVTVGAVDATVTMNRPEVCTALNQRAHADQKAIFQRIPSEAEALAGRVASIALLVVRYLKEDRHPASAGDLNQFSGQVSGPAARLFLTKDHRDGAARFPEKRLPVFRGC